MLSAPPPPHRPLRRRLLCAAAGAALLARPGLLRASEGPLSDFSMAAEFDPQEAVWLSHDAGHEALTTQLAAALLPHVTVKLMLRDGAALERASELLRPLGSAARSVQYMVEPAAAFFLRDMAVFASGPAGRLGVVDFRWNDYGKPAWCSRRHAGDAPRAATCSVIADPRRDGVELAIARHAGASVHQSDLFMEGGGVEVNGRGTLIANAAGPLMAIYLLAMRLPKMEFVGNDQRRTGASDRPREEPPLPLISSWICCTQLPQPVPA